MKKQYVILLITGLLFTFTVTGFSQTIAFTYDNAGNRLTRALIVEKVNNNNTPESESNLKSTELLNESVTINNIKVSISPNPNGGKFSVDISNSTNEQPNVEIYLHTMLGKQIFISKPAQPSTTINITNRKNGTYILTVVVNSTKEAWKIIKQ